VRKGFEIVTIPDGEAAWLALRGGVSRYRVGSYAVLSSKDQDLLVRIEKLEGEISRLSTRIERLESELREVRLELEDILSRIEELERR
jgi:nucleoside-triphosphatase THEP1